MSVSDIHLLKARSLELGYTQGNAQKTILAGLDLEMRPGEFICLLGPNGTGKSTLIRSLSGLQNPLSGDIEIQGQAISKLAPRDRARLISVVLTEGMPSGIMDGRMLVSMGRHPYSGWLGRLSEHDQARIDWALESVDAKHLADRQVSELSDGERQKISMARALAQEAKLMFLDEPTAFLDLPRRVELMSLLRQLAHREQMGLLLSTHDLDLALRYADRIWMIEGDQLRQGYPEVLALEGQLAQAFSNHNLTWDTEHGIFRPQRATCLDVYLEGSGPQAIWTRRALDRLGYGLCTNPEQAKFSLHLQTGEWNLISNEGTRSFGQLSEVIDYLKQIAQG